MSHPLDRIARQITDEFFKQPVFLGRRYDHPEDGPIEIVSGQWLDPVYGRLSNHWRWKVIATGEIKAGYGENWPEISADNNDDKESS